MNRNFGKLISGAISFAPDIIVDGNFQWVNPSAEKYSNAGYLPVIWEKPQGTNFNGTFEETDGAIFALYEETINDVDLEDKIQELEDIVQDLILAQWEAEENV